MRFLVTTFALITIFICAVPAAKTANPAPKHSHRYIVASTLQRSLARTPLRGQGFVFEAEGHRWNVNPFFVAAITGTESSFGAARCGWNVFGWNSCRGDSFTSFADAISVVTRALRENYMNRWNLGTVELIGVVYCRCGSHWAANTRSFMRRLGDTSGGVVYP